METRNVKDSLMTLQLLYCQPKEYRYYDQTRWYITWVHLKLYHKSVANEIPEYYSSFR